ncbi:MAG TPA: hypothetical protein ACFYD3_01485 [Candidatus Hypogeohydataceae bacterium YC41]
MRIFLPFVFFPIPHILLGFTIWKFAYRLASIAPELFKYLARLTGLGFCCKWGKQPKEEEHSQKG